MKRLLLIFVIALMTSSAFAQGNPNLFWAMTINVKMDKKLEWEKKLPVYVKTHHPTAKYRVYEVISGENTGSYVIVMGPMSYKDVEAMPPSPKGEAAARTDGLVLDAITNSLVVNYSRRVENISNIKADRKLKYLVVTQTTLQVGKWGDVSAFLLKGKEARTQGGSTLDIDYFRPSNSGPGNGYASVRYIEKLEELDAQTDFTEMYDKVHGNNAYFKDLNAYYALVQSTSTEIRVLRPDLSSM